MTRMELLALSGLPTHEAERLLVVALGLESRTDLLAVYDVAPDAEVRFIELAQRRLSAEPIQYLEGSIPFGPLELMVDRRVLIPRPETEQLMERATAGPAPGVAVDLCTGSGALAVALAYSFPDAEVHGTDVSGAALDVARANASAAEVAIGLWEGDLFAPLPARLAGRIDLLVANPPYVSDTEWETLDDSVREHEPRVALVGGPTGLEVLQRIAGALGDWLAPGGRYMIEIGATQGEAARGLFAGSEIQPDLFGRDRFVIGSL